MLEVDAVTGGAAKSLLKTDSSPHALSADGKRFAVFDADRSRVTIHDLDRGEKHSSAALVDPEPNMPKPSWTDLALAFSRDGRRLFASRGRERVYVLNADTGELLPRLEGMKEVALFSQWEHAQGLKPILDVHAFSGDGRLLVTQGEWASARP